EVRPGPQRPGPERPIATEAEARALVDWAEFQWRIRRDSYARYKRWLGVESLPHLTNYAGITPPIEENVPGKEHEARPAADDFARLYSEWWFAMNRIEADLDVCEYGLISWLGVAAYDEGVFARYINTARRRRGPNMEENWGFGTLYHAYSRHALVPFFQTLASVAGGATGYVVFCGLNHDHWDDSLDRVTRKQHPTFPSHAPIAADGSLTPMYDAMKLLNSWFEQEGNAFLEAEMPADVCWLIDPAAAAISSWVPDGRYWSLPQDIPRCGLDLEPLSLELQRAGYIVEMLDVSAVDVSELLKRRVCAIRPSAFMDAATRAKLDAFQAAGGKLLRPEEAGPAGLRALGIEPRIRHDPGLRCFLYERGADLYLWFFSFARDAGPHEHALEARGRRLEMRLGSKTAGVVHLRGERIASVLWKGANEVEGTVSEVSIRCGAQEVRARGDFIAFFD
ncbi:MAG TPA: hypothetical protein VHF22_12105, partial [Planctomycetota bacterium]|nr:hypothetical protein [Planctomycetota bacterium]